MRANSPLTVLYAGLIATYLPLSGIFWFPGVNPTLIGTAKLALYGALLGIAVISPTPIARTQSRVFVALILCAGVALASSLHTSESGVAVEACRTFLEPAIWLFILARLPASGCSLLLRFLPWTMLLVFLVTLLPIAVYWGLAPNLFPPPEFATFLNFDDSASWVQESISLGASGFTGSRTGWGAIVSLSGLFLLSLWVKEQRSSLLRVVMAVLLVLCCSLSIVVTGARSGLLTFFGLALVGLLFRVTLSRPQRIVIILLSSLGAAAFLFATDSVQVISRLTRGMAEGQGAYDLLNTATTGRLDSYVGAIALIADSPITGVGPSAATIALPSGEFVRPHNVWLRLLAESGLVLLLPLAYVTGVLIGLVPRTHRTPEHLPMFAAQRPPDTGLVVACGLILGVAEPAVVFGSMNSNAVFWTAVALALRARRIPVRADNQPSLTAAWVRRPSVGATQGQDSTIAQ